MTSIQVLSAPTNLTFQTHPLISLKQSTECGAAHGQCLQEQGPDNYFQMKCAAKRVVELAQLEEWNFKELNSVQRYAPQQFLCLEQLKHRTVFTSKSQEKQILHGHKGNLWGTRAVVSKGYRPRRDCFLSMLLTRMANQRWFMSLWYELTTVFIEELMFSWIHRLNFGMVFLPSKTASVTGKNQLF